MILLEGLAWAAVCVAVALAPFAIGGAIADDRLRPRAAREWHHEGHERHPD